MGKWKEELEDWNIRYDVAVIHLLIRERHYPALQSRVNRPTQIAITYLANGPHSRLLETCPSFGPGQYAGQTV